MHHEHQEKDTSHADLRAQILADFRATFSTPAGKRVLAVLESSAALHTPSSRFSSSRPIDPYLTHYLDGRKSIVLEIRDHLAQPADSTPKPPKAKK